jgi:hypothetical protein
VRARLYGLDVDGADLDTVDVEDATHFALSVAASVGAEQREGGELFYFTVCSPSWVGQDPLPKGFAFQRHTLLLERWDPAMVERAIGDLCRNTSGCDWNEVALKLSRFGAWEFEDYRAAPEVGEST